MKDILETRDRKPRAGDNIEEMKKELKGLKVIKKREEPFVKEEIQAFYTKMDDGRSRYDGWRRDLKRE